MFCRGQWTQEGSGGGSPNSLGDRSQPELFDGPRTFCFSYLKLQEFAILDSYGMDSWASNMAAPAIINPKVHLAQVPPKEFKLHVVSPLENDALFNGYPLTVENMADPQVKDLMDGVKDACPELKREPFRLYARYGTDKFFPIVDYLTLRAAFKLMDAHNSNLLYAVILGNRFAVQDKYDVMRMGDVDMVRCRKKDIDMMLELFGDHEVTPSLKRAMPEHAPAYKESPPAPPPPTRGKPNKPK
ncbi:hypothetical protein AAG570_008454 [Ranatra chinensis]|uniref:Uncharacterized protein n=1 Tax=Ranatra chinensis TaxID=642074 RepID=A0ABD0YQY2_9HEMI